LTSRAKRAIRSHNRTGARATLTLTVRYADGRSRTARRTITVRL
jgi:hypothetical protein